jgi:hypothetical protein
MIGESRSWSARAVDVRATARAAGVGIVFFLVSFALLHAPPLDRHQIVDTPVYQRYGDAMLAGQVPYRDFELEYPPAALPVFALPSLGPAEHYRSGFEALVALLGVATVAAVAVTLRALGAGPERLLAGCALVGLAPLALGTVVLTRFDAWPALLLVLAVGAAVSGRERLSLGLLGLGAAAKVFPAVAVPLVLLAAWRRGGLRHALAGLAAFAAVAAACLAPFAALSPHGLADAFTKQASRPLQVESLGSALLLAAHQLGAYEPTVISSSGSQNLAGSLPDGLASVSTAIQILAVAAVWVLFAARKGGAAELPAAVAASVCAFAAFGKVLSPQFLVWLVPLVPLVAGRLGVLASGLLAVVLVLTQLWFPQRYWDLVDLQAGPTWLLVARDLGLVALFAVLLSAVATRPVRGSLRTA